MPSSKCLSSKKSLKRCKDIFCTIVSTQNSWFITNRTNDVQEVSRREVWVVYGNASVVVVNANFQPNNTPAVSVRIQNPNGFSLSYPVRMPYIVWPFATLSNFQRQQDQQFLECCELIPCQLSATVTTLLQNK